MVSRIWSSPIRDPNSRRIFIERTRITKRHFALTRVIFGVGGGIVEDSGWFGVFGLGMLGWDRVEKLLYF